MNPLWLLRIGDSGAVIPPVVAPSTGGGGKSKRRKKWPKRVMVRGQLYWVRSWEEELSLLQASLDRAEYQAAIAPETEAVAPIPALRKRIKRVESERDKWLARLRRADEEILLLMH